MSTLAKVAALKKVDFPTFGLPTRPIRTLFTPSVASLFLVGGLLASDHGQSDVKFRQVDFSITVKIDCFEQGSHFPWREVRNVCVLESPLEFKSVNCAGVVQVNGLEELEDRLV